MRAHTTFQRFLISLALVATSAYALSRAETSVAVDASSAACARSVPTPAQTAERFIGLPRMRRAGRQACKPLLR
jgi:hypothetical protein